MGARSSLDSDPDDAPDPTFEEWREAIREGRGVWIPIEQLVPDWQDRLRRRGTPDG